MKLGTIKSSTSLKEELTNLTWEITRFKEEIGNLTWEMAKLN